MPPATDASTVACDELLVAGDHRLVRAERGLHQCARGLDAADHLHHDVDVGIGHDGGRVVGEHARRQLHVAWTRDVADGDASDADARARPSGDQVGVLVDEARERTTHIPAPEQADSHVTHVCHGRHCDARSVARMNDQPSSSASRSSRVSRRTTTRAAPSRTNTTAGRGTLL
jgi:hypothetical protein